MTPLEIIYTIIIWIILGGFICHKRKWYKHLCTASGDDVLAIAAAFVASPIVLIIVLVRLIIINNWDNS
jgi:uncharacterized membrane protein